MSNPRSNRLHALTAFLFVFFLTACGGGGGGAMPSAANAAPSSPKPFQIISQNGSSITLSGTVVAMISGGFQVQGGQGVGYLHIYVNGQTVITGPTPFIGENVLVSGTGSLQTGNITASSVAEIVASPSPSPSANPTSAPQGQPQPTPGPTGAPIQIPQGIVAQAGQVTSVSGSNVVVQGGPGCGFAKITLSSGTAYFDGTVQVGQFGVFIGTGSRCNSVTTGAVALSGSTFGSGTLAGTVGGSTPYGFTLSASSGSVPVALTSATVVFGGSLAVGSQVTVTGLGTASTGLIATQIAVQPPPTPTPNPSVSPSPTPGPISQTHVPVAGYIYGYGGAPTNIPLNEMSPYVNWAFTDEQHASALRAAGLKVMVYSNFWRNYTSDSPNIGYTDLEPGGPHASAEATDCSGNPVYDPSYGGGYEADPRTASALAHAQVVANYRLAEYGGNDDALFSDDSGAVGGITSPCNYVESTYDQAVNAVHSALGVPLWINALGAAPNPVNATDLAQPANVLGAMCEQCYTTNGTVDGMQTGSAWQNVENAQITMIGMQKVFWAYARATGNAAAETNIRMYAIASYLLTYDPQYTMFQEALSTPSGFPVMPEIGLVPTQPLTTASNVSGYQAAGGAYFREYAACYYQGQFVGKCAVAVNSSAANEPLPSTSYTHSMVLSGSGVLDGGTVSFNGPQVSQLAPSSAAIVFP